MGQNLLCTLPDDMLKAIIRKYNQTGSKIVACKFTMDQTQCSLRDAKDLLDHIEVNGIGRLGKL